MAVQDQPNFVSYTTDGISSAYAVPFYFTTASDLLVMVGTIIQTLGSTYTVTGTLDPKLNTFSNGGSVVFAPVLGAGQTLFIMRQLPRTQPYVWTPGDPFPAGTEEAGHDRAMLVIQDALDAIDCVGAMPAPPVGGSYDNYDWIKNNNPVPGGFFGWVFIGGSWYAFGQISLTPV